MPLSIWLLDKSSATLLLAVALLVVLLFEVLRRQEHVLGQTLQNAFSPVLRHTETASASKLTGAAYMLIGALLVTVFAPAEVAITALTVLMISDTLSALIGRRWGKHPIAGKSVEGSAVFILSAIMITGFLAFLGNYPYGIFFITGCVASSVAMLVELFAARLRLDDNFSVPVSFALTQTFLLSCFNTAVL